jgi:hypothetical protein
VLTTDSTPKSDIFMCIRRAADHEMFLASGSRR